MKVLVDTSIWSLALRRDAHPGAREAPEVSELRRLILARQAVIIGPIRQELLCGVRDRTQFKQLETHLAAFPDLELSTEDYVVAAQFYNLCRAKGIQGSNTDFLICASAVRREFAVFTTDCDFRHFAKFVPVLLHEPSASPHRGAGPGS